MGFGQRADVGKYLDPYSIGGHTWTIPVHLQLPPVTLSRCQARLRLTSAHLIGGNCHHPSLSIDYERCTLVDLGKRPGHTNHGRNTQALCHNSKMTRRRSRLRHNGLQVCRVQPNRLGGSEVLRDKNGCAIQAYLQGYPPQFRYDTATRLAYILCAGRQVRIGKARKLFCVASCNTRDGRLGGEAGGDQGIGPLL